MQPEGDRIPIFQESWIVTEGSMLYSTGMLNGDRKKYLPCEFAMFVASWKRKGGRKKGN